jgi:hypothetical protein
VESPDKSDSLRAPISVSLLLGRRTIACLALLAAPLCTGLAGTKAHQIDRLLVGLLEQRFQRPTIVAPESLTGISFSRAIPSKGLALARTQRDARKTPHSHPHQALPKV